MCVNLITVNDRVILHNIRTVIIIILIVTILTTLADSYIQASASSAGAEAEMAASRKLAKYESLSPAYLVQPIALETLGPINESAV